jgi:hypothetical protein
MMQYPPELTAGDAMCATSSLSKFFKDRGWSVTWDFDNKGRWFEIMYNGKIIMQIEEDVSINEFIKTVKDFVPSFNSDLLDPSSLDEVNKFVSGKNLYIWSDTHQPRWKGAPC